VTVLVAVTVTVAPAATGISALSPLAEPPGQDQAMSPPSSGVSLTVAWLLVCPVTITR
jgi:hypothetical protein